MMKIPTCEALLKEIEKTNKDKSAFLWLFSDFASQNKNEFDGCLKAVRAEYPDLAKKLVDKVRYFLTNEVRSYEEMTKKAKEFLWYYGKNSLIISIAKEYMPKRTKEFKKFCNSFLKELEAEKGTWGEHIREAYYDLKGEGVYD